ncbi:hypothetical protein HK101_001855, partial [Irineochytrium annulatum]
MVKRAAHQPPPPQPSHQPIQPFHYAQNLLREVSSSDLHHHQSPPTPAASTPDPAATANRLQLHDHLLGTHPSHLHLLSFQPTGGVPHNLLSQPTHHHLSAVAKQVPGAASTVKNSPAASPHVLQGGKPPGSASAAAAAAAAAVVAAASASGAIRMAGNAVGSANSSTSSKPAAGSATTPNMPTGGPRSVVPETAPSANQAAFIHKLYSMLEDVNVQGLICWDPTGTFFIVNNPTDFSKSVLPQYFKHNNFASFVRQLNMYGFHKINDTYYKLANNSEVWEFKHPDFRRGEVDLLQNIKRKAPTKMSSSKGNNGGGNAANFANGAADIKDERIDMLSGKVIELEEKLAKLHESYNLLWSETVACRLLQSKHHQVITNMTSFLASIYKEDTDRKRKFE